MILNIVETEYQSSIPIKGVCHDDLLQTFTFIGEVVKPLVNEKLQ